MLDFLRTVYFPLLPLDPFQRSWTRQQAGLWGELAVARHLWYGGHRILEHRWVSNEGSDIDLIASTDRRLIFAEVKLRTSREDDLDPWRQVFDRERLGHLARAAGEFLAKTQQRQVSIRFDAFLVVPRRDTPRRPELRVERGYLNPATVPGWRGIPDPVATGDLSS